MDENKLIDGKKIAADLRAETAVKVEAFKKDFNKVPTLAVVLILILYFIRNLLFEYFYMTIAL